MEKKKPKTTSISGDNRNSDGTFKPGVSGNPGGLPVGTVSITALIKQKLQDEAITTSGEKKKYVLLFVESILKNAIQKGDHNAQKMIWNYIDGLPKGSLDLTTKGQKINTFDSAQVKRIAQEVLNAQEDESK